MPALGLRTSIVTLVSLLMGAIMFALITVVAMVSHQDAIEQGRASARAAITNHAAIIQKTINMALVGARAISSSVEIAVKHDHIERDMLSHFVRETLVTNDRFSTTWIVMGPGPFDGRNDELKGQRQQDVNGVYLPFFARQGDVVADVYDPSDDATIIHNHEVFRTSFDQKREAVSEPYYDSYGAYEWLISITSPILDPQDNAIGVAGVDLTLHDLQTQISRIKPYGVGFAFMVSPKGMVIAHPNAQFLGKSMELLGLGHDGNRLPTADKVIDTVLTYAGEDYMLISTPLTIDNGQKAGTFSVMFPVSVITTPAEKLVKTLFIIGLAFVGAGFIAAWLVGIRIAEPIIRMTGVMNRMTDGDLDVTIPDAPEGTEIGKMAHAMKLFRDNALELREFENREIATHLQTEREKRELMDGIIARFEESIGGIIDMVSAAALALNTFSQDMSITAEASSELSSLSANSSEEASRNVAAISSATDELSVVGSTISERAQAARDGLDALTSYLQSLPSDTALADVDQIIPQIAAISQEAHGICESISEQENAIQEVARNIALVSQSAHDLSQTTQSVKTVAKETGDAAMQINVAAADLAQQAGVLQSEVTAFLDRIRGRHPGQINPEQ